MTIDNDSQLMQLSHLDTLLAQATRIDEITEVRARAEAMRTYAVNIRASRKTCQEYAMVRIRAERKAGQVLSTLNLLGNNQHGRVSDDSISLKDCGITPDESYRWRTIAQLPDDDFENNMLERFQSGDEITTAFFYNAGYIYIHGNAQRSDRVSIPIDDPILAAQLIRRKLTTQNVAQLIDELRKQQS